MIVLLLFAFVSGIITILSPCILPVLPIVLSGSVGGGRARPFGIVAAFVASFTVFTLALSAIVQALHIPPDTMRFVSVILLVIFGLIMIVPALRDRFEILASRISSRGAAKPAGSAAGGANGQRSAWSGFWSGIPVGFSLGLVWTPCVGPIMASVISLALTQHVDSGAVSITIAYSLGTSIPMLAVMFGGRALLNRVPGLSRNMANIQKAFGALMILVGVAIGFGWDRDVQTALLNAFPNYGAGLTAIEQNSAVKTALQERKGTNVAQVTDPNAPFPGATGEEPKNAQLGNYGMAPDLIAQGPWYNTGSVVAGLAGTQASMSTTDTGAGSPPLTLADLRGKVVLVDFWTYSCVNCVRTLPYLKAWYETYKSDGLVIIGVHTPEFEFERVPRNVQQAVHDLGVDYPVVQDNNYAEWNAYHNEYWPAHYFIDATGHIRYYHFGEGDYATSEKVIQELLKEAGHDVTGIVSKPAQTNYAQTPETYLGYDRSRGLANKGAQTHNEPFDFQSTESLGNGQWSLGGTWTITPQYVSADTDGTLSLRFNSKNVFLVVQPSSDGSDAIHVSVDGRQPADTSDVKSGVVRPDESRLYQVVGLDKPGNHLLKLDVSKGVKLFAFTFG